MNALSKGEIDFGQFAVKNSLGGQVTESIEALKKYNPETLEEFEFPIRHFLMKRKNVPLGKITSVMAHEQVFAQCRNSMRSKFPNLKQITGTGDMRDTARAAETLADGQIPETTAILGSKILAEIYGFDIIESNLQDGENNVSVFRVVALRRGSSGFDIVL